MAVGVLETMWERPALRLVTDEFESRDPFQTRRSVRRISPKTFVWRRLWAGLVLAGILGLLCLPVRILGGERLAPHPSSMHLVAAQTYVVKTGETLYELATSITASNARNVASAIKREVGTTQLYGGERIRLP